NCPSERRNWEWHYLARLCDADLQTLKLAGASRAAFSPDWTQVALGGVDGSVKLLDLPSEQEIRCIKAHDTSVVAISYSADGRMLASAIDGIVKVFEVKTGRLLHSMQGTWPVALSPDGARLAAGIRDLSPSIVIWDSVSGQRLFTVQAVSNIVRLAFSPDGTRLAAGCAGGGLQIWEVRERRSPLLLSGHHRFTPVYCVIFSPDGSRLASGGGDQTVKIWDTASG